MDTLHFLLLNTGLPSRHLVRAIQDAGHTYDAHDPRDLYLFVSESEHGHDRLYNGQSKLENPVRIKAGSYDAVLSRIGAELSHGAAILRHVNENLGIYSPQDADGLETASNKLKTTQRLSSSGLKVPKTIYGKQVAHIDFVIKKLDGLPAVAKLLQGSQGKGVMLMETKLAANTMLESFYKLNASLKIQRFIDAKGKDIRAIVVGDKISVAMERTSNKGDFRANLSQNGSGRKVTLSENDQKLCINAAKACNLEFAGVDLMKDEKGNSFVVEVNGNPGTKIIDLTGHNYFADLVSFVESQVSGSNKKKASEAENQAVAMRLGQIADKQRRCLYVSKEERDFVMKYGPRGGRS